MLTTNISQLHEIVQQHSLVQTGPYKQHQFSDEFSIDFIASHSRTHTSKCHDFDDFTRTHVVVAYPQLFVCKTESGIAATSRHTKYTE